jgi:hypothetical protein
LTLNNLLEKKTNYNLANWKLVEESTSDLLKKQLVKKVSISLILVQMNDVSINLITGVIV